jgi:hypothetical protein
MNKEKAHFTSNEEGARVYKNPILHYLSSTHIAIPLCIFYGAGIAISLYAGIVFKLHWGSILFFFFIGLLFFTLVEYLVHRYLYHLPSVYKEKK